MCDEDVMKYAKGGLVVKSVVSTLRVLECAVPNFLLEGVKP